MLDYNEVKKTFADKLANDAEGMGRFESAFYHTMQMVYNKGVEDGRLAQHQIGQVVGIIDHKETKT